MLAVEEEGGAVVGFMGTLAWVLLPNSDACFRACVGVAKGISDIQDTRLEFYPQSTGGPRLDIGVEFGTLDISMIESKELDRRRLVVGEAINYATPILAAGDGNRCLVGLRAAAAGLWDYTLGTKMVVAGKPGDTVHVPGADSRRSLEDGRNRKLLGIA